MSITVSTFFQDKNEDLKLDLVSGVEGTKREIKVSEINRPGLAFTGYLGHFPAERMQIIGLGEQDYLKSLPLEKQTKILEKIFSFSDIPCFILARGLEPLPEMTRLSEKFKIPVFKTPVMTSQLMGELIFYLENKMSPSTKLHGVLVRVYGLGVLIIGDAGIGKSECALELVKRDHMLVADDVVVIFRRSGNRIIGRGEEIIKHHMEIRGLGIIDVKSLFGIGYILDETNIELVIRLEDWKKNMDYERVGLEENFTTILNVQVPEVVLPVGPGRNLAVLVEIASLNQRLKNQGHYSAQELNQKLIQQMSKKL
ncbi:MAG: HPr(Ser) kinase/phosphatase [Elusimicrobia bacterium]|nr:HPr(Ser) kinase/phosphatase [Elusimicrobiota bacterium]